MNDNDGRPLTPTEAAMQAEIQRLRGELTAMTAARDGACNTIDLLSDTLDRDSDMDDAEWSSWRGRSKETAADLRRVGESK